MLSSFLLHIKKEQLFSPTEKVLLTVSGGVDSVVMCELFHNANLNFAIAHCNFQLRGKESDGDEIFVKALAKKYGVEFYNIAFDTSGYAKKNKLSTQVAARELRYKWFEKIRKGSKCKYIATAHHKDDSIETFFINLLRGTGIKGMHGILPKNEKIIRPLLFCGKEEIKKYAIQNKLHYREDSSNASVKYVRNKIRHKIIPALKEMNPRLEETIINNIEHLREIEKIYQQAIDQQQQNMVTEKKGEVLISVSLLKNTIAPTTFLYEFLQPYGFNETIVKEIIAALDGISGKEFSSSTHRLVKDRETLIVQRLKSKVGNQKSIVTDNKKEITIDDLKLHFSKTTKLPTSVFQLPATIAQLDYDKLTFPLEIRKWEKGDTFYPLGMKGKKKLSDFFIDRKIPVSEKENTYLLLSDNKIAWVIGQRIDDRFKISNTTQNVYIVKIV